MINLSVSPETRFKNMKTKNVSNFFYFTSSVINIKYTVTILSYACKKVKIKPILFKYLFVMECHFNCFIILSLTKIC